MAYLSMSTRDLNVLEKIKDPESDPSTSVFVDSTLPKDPHVREAGEYDRLVAAERQVVLSMQALEMELAGLRPNSSTDPIAEYKKCVGDLSGIISGQPSYASARNNRAQAARRLYGDNMLLAAFQGAQKPLIPDSGQAERVSAASRCLTDLDEAISLLTPASLYAGVSPVAAKTLSLAHTQRAAIYHFTSKMLASNILDVDSQRREANWGKLEFEEAASRDFAMGGRYGNEVAKGLAVSTNPTAKLCGQMVREAMKREYGPDFAN